MAETTHIAWCDSTINFWEGCTKVSLGCIYCYAEARDKRHMIEDVDHWGKGAPRRKSKSAIANAFGLNKFPWVCDLCGHGMALRPAGHYCGVKGCRGQSWHRRRVFSLSLGDWLDEEVPIEWFVEMLDTIRQCTGLDFLLCTKRPELFFARLYQAISHVESKKNLIRGTHFWMLWTWLLDWSLGRPPGNVWALTSTENQELLEKRVPELLKIPAVIHGLSCEPLLGPLSLGLPDKKTAIIDAVFTPLGEQPKPAIDWVIAGGESGPNARPCQVEWLRNIQKQCAAAGVAYFCKQFGSDPRQDLSAVIPESDITDPELQPEDIAAWEAHRHSAALHLKDKKGGDMSQWPDVAMRVRQFPTVN